MHSRPYASRNKRVKNFKESQCWLSKSCRVAAIRVGVHSTQRRRRMLAQSVASYPRAAAQSGKLGRLPRHYSLPACGSNLWALDDARLFALIKTREQRRTAASGSNPFSSMWTPPQLARRPRERVGDATAGGGGHSRRQRRLRRRWMGSDRCGTRGVQEPRERFNRSPGDPPPGPVSVVIRQTSTRPSTTGW